MQWCLLGVAVGVLKGSFYDPRERFLIPDLLALPLMVHCSRALTFLTHHGILPAFATYFSAQAAT